MLVYHSGLKACCFFQTKLKRDEHRNLNKEAPLISCHTCYVVILLTYVLLQWMVLLLCCNICCIVNRCIASVDNVFKVILQDCYVVDRCIPVSRWYFKHVVTHVMLLTDVLLSADGTFNMLSHMLCC